MDYKKFLPFDFRDYDILDISKGDETYEKYKDSNMFHMWETIWRPQLECLNDGAMKLERSGFERLFSRFVDV